MAKFYPPRNQETANEINSLLAGGNLFCLDWQKDAQEVFGAWSTGDNF